MKGINNMPDERRNDLGQKILIGVILGAFGTVTGLFTNSMFSVAGEGKSIAMENRIEIRSLQTEVRQQYIGISRDMEEIKTLLRRTVHVERIDHDESKKNWS